MSESFWDKLRTLSSNRLLPVGVLLGIVSVLIVTRLFHMQMVDNDVTDVESDSTSYTRTVPVSATRGEIYDCNGVLLAYNDLQYNLEMYDSAELSTNAEKNEAIFSLIELLRDFDYEREFPFYLALTEDGELEFTVEGNALLRFKKNAYGLASVNDLSQEQIAATAEDVFAFMRYGDKSSRMFQIDESYSMEDALEIMAYRYQLFILYPSYSSFRIVSDISEEARISFYENTTKVPGLEITKTSKRVYDHAVYFAHIIGYVGRINEEELEQFGELSPQYTENSIVGKLGIEKSYETYLAGIDGEATIIINERGQVVSKTVTKEPVSGNNLYLTVDAEMQTACYHILERNIAAILLSKLVPTMDYGGKGEDASEITIPIYEAYYALIDNHVINTDHFREADATELEKKVLAMYDSEEERIWNQLLALLQADNTVSNEAAGSTMQEYLEYVYQKLGSDGWGILLNSEIDTEDEQYLAYVNQEISLSAFLQYAITQNWLSLDKLNIGSDYYETTELYGFLYDYLVENLRDDDEYRNKIYRTLIFNYTLKGRDLCLLLFEQGVLEEDAENIQKLEKGTLSAYDFLLRKIKLLEITPAMLALEPCSGSICATDPDSGEVICLVSYPSYDNNYLTNSVDMEYYQKLYEDGSYPMVNRATTSRTTTGSTFKPLTAIAGLTEPVISATERIQDKIKFEAIVPSPSCWSKYSHGAINVTDAIRFSCNYFFFEVGYRMSMSDRGEYDDAKGINTIQKYASYFGLSDKSGVEISESQPAISNRDAVRTAIGYGHSFAPVQIARYLTTLTNEGTCYNLTLLDRIVAQNGELMLSNTATVRNQITNVAQSSWDAVKLGMYRVVNADNSSLKKVFGDLSVKVAGKTGTAQVSLNHPHNALFISFAPYSDPEICVTVVIPNGYGSANAAYVCREVYGFYFEDENREALLSGSVFAGTVVDIEVGD
ncbi:MAG: penicillin-binding transpeptidase domain-containing protein [Lachnospiraceae bacterium]|nr:penicillin-binding transpeptidase domain-containing protein [Lachnospiraceae bacterium]